MMMSLIFQAGLDNDGVLYLYKLLSMITMSVMTLYKAYIVSWNW